MFTQNINPDLITLGPFSIRFYGIVYALGFLLITYLLEKMAEKRKIKNLTKDRVYDLTTITMIAGLLGARIFHVIFDFHLYKNNLWQVFAIWKGGLGFQGGLIGALLALYLYTKKHDIKFLEITDFGVVYIPFIVGFGRIANYINSENYGPVTNLPWCVVFQKVDNVCRHPTQFYQAISQFVFFGVMMLMNKSKFKDKKGNMTLFYVIIYSLMRLVTDFWRVFPRFFGLSITQIFAVLMFFIGLYLLVKNNNTRVRL